MYLWNEFKKVTHVILHLIMATHKLTSFVFSVMSATDLLEVLCLTEAFAPIFMANNLSPEIIGGLLPQSSISKTGP
jgi:hypothetical protein